VILAVGFMSSPRRVGITSTLPVEVIWAAGAIPLDLNNLFINDARSEDLVKEAEKRGIPPRSCGWVKGIFPVPSSRGMEEVAVVSGGDCSDLVALSDYWEDDGIGIVHFTFPIGRDRKGLLTSLENLCNHFQITMEEAGKKWQELVGVRRKLADLDDMMAEGCSASAEELHGMLVGGSDMNGDPQAFEKGLDDLLARCHPERIGDDEIRIAYVGVPPIIKDMFSSLEDMGCRVVLDETAVQFGMAYRADDMVDQYLKYTYPYGARSRSEWIVEQVHRRKVDGIVLYTEAACFRNLSNQYLRERFPVPVVEIQGENPAPLDARNRMRLESFIQILRMGRDGI